MVWFDEKLESDQINSVWFSILFFQFLYLTLRLKRLNQVLTHWNKFYYGHLATTPHFHLHALYIGALQVMSTDGARREGGRGPTLLAHTWGGHHLRLELWSLVFQWRPLLICSLQMSAQKYFNPLWVPWAVVGFWFHCLLFSVTVQQYVTT